MLSLCVSERTNGTQSESTAPAAADREEAKDADNNLFPLESSIDQTLSEDARERAHAADEDTVDEDDVDDDAVDDDPAKAEVEAETPAPEMEAEAIAPEEAEAVAALEEAKAEAEKETGEPSKNTGLTPFFVNFLNDKIGKPSS